MFGCCCKCKTETCGLYRFDNSYLSPSRTTVSITGNHPGSIVVPTVLQEAGPFVSCLNATNSPQCCIAASGLADYTLDSTPIWARFFRFDDMASRSYNHDNYRCCCDSTPISTDGNCNEPSEYNRKKILYGSYSLATSRSCRMTTALRYTRFGISFYNGKSNGCCGVWVEACLTWQRWGSQGFPWSIECNTAQNYSYSNTCTDALYLTPFGFCPETETDVGTCARTCITGDASQYPACPPESVPTMAQFDNPFSVTTTFLIRRKFFPGDPECSQRSFPFFPIQFTEADNFTWTSIQAPSLCGGSGRAADFVFLEKVIMTTDCECPAAPIFNDCGGTMPFIKLPTLCSDGCDPSTLSRQVGGIPLVPPVDCLPPDSENGCRGTAWICGLQEPVFKKFLGSCHSHTEINGLQQSFQQSSTLPDCRTLIYGELQDTWNISINPV